MSNPYWLICYWGREGKDKGIGYRSLWKFSEIISIHPSIYIKKKNDERKDKCEYVLISIRKMNDEEIEQLIVNGIFSPEEYYQSVLEKWE